MKIKQILILIVAFIFMTSLSACNSSKKTEDLLSTIKERGYIKAGVKFDSKPFGYIDENQKLQGFDVDLIKEITKRLLGNAEKVKFEQVNSSNRIFSLTSGSLDLVAATMTINSKRAAIIDFSQPYYVAGQAIMTFNNSDIKLIKDLNNRQVAIVLGSTSEETLRELAPNAIVKGFRTYTDAFSAIKMGRAEAITTDDTIIVGFMSDNPGFKILNERYTQEPYGIGFKKSPETKSFQKAVDNILEEMKADGTIKRLTKKWMNANDNV